MTALCLPPGPREQTVLAVLMAVAAGVHGSRMPFLSTSNVSEGSFFPWVFTPVKKKPEGKRRPNEKKKKQKKNNQDNHNKKRKRTKGREDRRDKTKKKEKRKTRREGETQRGSLLP